MLPDELQDAAVGRQSLDSVSYRVTVTGELTIATSAVWRDRFVQALGDAAEVCVDLGGVESCDVAGLQLLVSLDRSAKARGVMVRLTAVPERVRELAARLGLALGTGERSADGL